VGSGCGAEEAEHFPPYSGKFRIFKGVWGGKLHIFPDFFLAGQLLPAFSLKMKGSGGHDAPPAGFGA
jgi:hypothetical protein